MTYAYIYDVHRKDGSPVAVHRFECEDMNGLIKVSRPIAQIYPDAEYGDMDLFTERDGTEVVIWQLVIA